MGPKEEAELSEQEEWIGKKIGKIGNLWLIAPF